LKKQICHTKERRDEITHIFTGKPAYLMKKQNNIPAKYSFEYHQQMARKMNPI